MARPPRLVRPIVAAVAIAVALTAAIGCSEGASDRTPPTGGDPVQSVLGDSYPRFRDAESGYTVILGTPDLAVGTQRVAFVLSDSSGIVRLPVLRLTSLAPGTDPTASQDATARFYEFPLGTRGIHVTDLTFDRPGEWTLELRIPTPTGAVATTRFPTPVAERSLSPAVGAPAPRSASRTLDDVAALEDLSTGAEIDADLYALSIDEALSNGLPTMIVFASPGFCTTPLCGPQVEMMSDLQARYPDTANYIHVDLFENPSDLRAGDLSRAIRSPLLAEWGLRTDEWTFLVTPDGHVAYRYEAFVPIEELEPAFTSLLAN